MDTVTVKLSIPDELREQFAARVREHRGDQGEYLQHVLERDLRGETPDSGMTLTEQLSLATRPSPADSMADEELSEFSEQEVKAQRAELRAAEKRA